MEYLNDKGRVLILPKEDRVMLIGALAIAIEAHSEDELATEPTKQSIKRLEEIKETLINTFKSERG